MLVNSSPREPSGHRGGGAEMVVAGVRGGVFGWSVSRGSC